MWRAVIVLDAYTKFREKIVTFTFPSLYYEGKVKLTIFSRNFVYASRTITARHMVSFNDFYFHFLANFQT